jgi:glucosamine--fructose-6-phosphate aminotransferase (isomerizing)
MPPQALRRKDPDLIVTVARGSSDHAATYLKYAFELEAGRSRGLGRALDRLDLSPALRLGKAACIGISQSGRSPDGVEMMRASGQGGALSIAITNFEDSPMAQVSAHCLPLQAGEEKSVAATKTFICSVLAGLSLLAEWQGRSRLQDACDRPARGLGRRSNWTGRRCRRGWRGPIRPLCWGAVPALPSPANRR